MKKTLAGCVLAAALLYGAETPKEQYSRAVFAVNAGRLAEARQILEALIASDASYFRAYDLLWDILAKSGVPDPQKVEVVARNLRAVPEASRTEDYYAAFLKTLALLHRDEEMASVRTELTRRFPRGSSAQTDLLARARQEGDAARSVALYSQFLKDFPDSPTQTQIVLRERLDRMAGAPDAFPLESLTNALDDIDTSARQAASANPYAYVFEMRRVAAMLVQKQPKVSLDAASRALRFIDDNWLKTTEFDESARNPLLVIQLRAFVQLKDTAAPRLATSLVRALDTDPTQFTPADEAIVRELQSMLLESSGAKLAAAEQKRRSTPESMEVRRTAAAKRNLLAQKLSGKAPSFHLVSTEGDPVSLEDFRGKPLVLAFWATWCKPCTEELPALDRWSKRWPQAKFLTISLDEQKAKIEQFVRANKISLPVLLADASAQDAYEADTLPKLYVIDAQGTLRFARSGTGPLAEFERDLGWMIEAVSAQN